MTDPTTPNPEQPPAGYQPFGGRGAPRHEAEPVTGELQPVHPPEYGPQQTHPQSPQYPPSNPYPQSPPYPPPPAQIPLSPAAVPYAYPAQPGYGAPPEPPKRSLTWLWVGLAAFVVLALAGAAAAIFVLRKNDTNEVTSPPSASAGASPADTPTASPTADDGGVATLALPDRLAGLTKSDAAQFTSLLDTMIDQLKSGMPGATHVGAGIYTDPKAAEKLVMVVQMKGDFPLSAVQVDGMLGGMGIGGLQVTDIKSVNAGSAGGTAKCGKGDVNGVSMTVCAWGGDGEIGMAVFYFRTQSQSTTLLTNIRRDLA